MHLRKLILFTLLLVLVLGLVSCEKKGEGITLNIQLVGDIPFNEINLLYVEYVPAEWVDQVGWVLRTCPEDREKNSQAGHHFYQLSKQDKGYDLQLAVFPTQGRASQQRELLKKGEIYLGEGLDAVLFYIEAWHVNELDRGINQKAYDDTFRSLDSSEKELLYANSLVIPLPAGVDVGLDFPLLAADGRWSLPNFPIWNDEDEDLFGYENGDCFDMMMVETVNRDGALENLIGCEVHPFAPPEGCMVLERLRCNCLPWAQVPTTTTTSTATRTIKNTPTVTPTQPTPTASKTPTITPTRPTPTPSMTPTSTRTPTATPTYNFAPLSRATSAAPAQCPLPGNPEPLDLASAGSIGEQELEQIRLFLSEGGSVEQVRLALTEVGREGILRQQDLTRDDIPEVILLQPYLDVLGCVGDSYQRLLRVYPEDPNVPVLQATIVDLNGNSVPELVVETEFWGVHNYTLNVRVYEWDGQEFVNRMPSQLDHPLLERGWLYWERGRALMYNGDLVLGDVDINGTIELVLRGGEIGGMEAMMSAPQLSQQHVWMWNGREFTLVDVTFSEPEFKFHAAQIGDLYSLMGKYDDAIAFYQQAIFDTELIAWNVEWMELAMMGSGLEPGQTWPSQDYDQGQRIGAYARFRMMLIYTLLGNDYAVETQYATIEKILEKDNPGSRYAELASAFRQAYLEEGESITAGCQAAREFTEQHESAILGPLSPGVYGVASWGYDAEEICPFGDVDRLQ